MGLLLLLLAAATTPQFIYIKIPAGIALTTSADPVRPGAPVVLTATVTGATPVGVVLFTDGGVPIGMPSLDGDGRAVLALPGLHPGDHVIEAVYQGDARNSLAYNTLTLHVLRPRPSPHWPRD